MRFGRRSLGMGLLCSAALLVALPASAQDSKDAPKPAVVIAPVVDQPIESSEVFIGTIEAIQQVELRARVEGFLEKVLFKEGQMVQANQLLYQIQKSQYQASLDQANATEQQGEAALQRAQAEVTDTQLEFERQAALLKNGNTSQARYDQARAARDKAVASASDAKAQIASAKADIEQAQLNLSYTDINTPITGKIGKTALTEGNLVTTNSGVLATVVQLDPIRVVFSISDADYVRVMEDFQKKKETPGQGEYTFNLTLPTGQPYQHPGSFSFVNNQVDPNTGTIAIRADFPNPQQLLVPGQFVRVTTSEAKPQTLPVVPAKAVQQDRKGRYVFVLGQDNRAERRDITVGPRTKDGWAVEKGLVPGEMVIVDGIQKVHNGVQVTPTQATSGAAGKQGDSQSSGQGGNGQSDDGQSGDGQSGSGSSGQSDGGGGGGTSSGGGTSN